MIFLHRGLPVNGNLARRSSDRTNNVYPCFCGALSRLRALPRRSFASQGRSPPNECGHESVSGLCRARLLMETVDAMPGQGQ